MGEEMCLTSLVEPPQQVHVLGKVLSPTLHMQLVIINITTNVDMCYVFGRCS